MNQPTTTPPFAVVFDCAPAGRPTAYQYFATEAAAAALAAQLTANGWPGVKVARTAN